MAMPFLYFERELVMRKLEEKSKMSLFEKLIVVSVISMMFVGFYIQSHNMINHHQVEVSK